MTADERRFVEQVAALGTEAIEHASFDSRVIEDLGLDSLAVLELMTMLLERFGRTAGVERLMTSDWSGVTIAQLWQAGVSR